MIFINSGKNNSKAESNTCNSKLPHRFILTLQYFGLP